MSVPPSPEELKRLVEEKNSYHPSTRGNLFSYILAGVILPMSYANTVYDRLQAKVYDKTLASEEEHQERVERVCKEVQEWSKLDSETRGLLRTKRSGNASHSVRTANKDGSHQVELGDLDRIIKLDKEKGNHLRGTRRYCWKMHRFLNQAKSAA